MLHLMQVSSVVSGLHGIGIDCLSLPSSCLFNFLKAEKDVPLSAGQTETETEETESDSEGDSEDEGDTESEGDSDEEEGSEEGSQP